MSALGFPEIFFAFFMLCVYGMALFIIWKFYNVLKKMNDNLTGIRQTMERSADGPHRGA